MTRVEKKYVAGTIRVRRLASPFQSLAEMSPDNKMRPRRNAAARH
jgi:hypothetical protein